jgi:hypothetical protein
MYAEHTHTRIYVSTNFWERFFHMDHRTKVKKSPSYASSWICFLLDVEVRYGIQNRGSYVPILLLFRMQQTSSGLSFTYFHGISGLLHSFDGTYHDVCSL